MSEILGKIDKPEAAQFKNGRKLFLVPLVVIPPNDSTSLTTLAAKYWEETQEQLSNLETKLSPIKRVYHEFLPSNEGIKRLDSMHIGSYRIVDSLSQQGALVEEIEDHALLGEFLDWNLCLSIRLQNAKVISKILESFQEVQAQRNSHIIKRIDETLQSDECAVFFIREEHHLQYPSDIQLFYVAPPALDTFKRELRKQQEERQKLNCKPVETQNISAENTSS
ncbi:MAG: hypothetical protein FWH42_05525 [Dehalococcoidia bacterium]|nr:hypothetical protein [Dehalococcoidia bacterium]